ncbi:p53 and DNA damage-regulated protein 1 [Hoplias malabaricus]|uniref:p53 and DNA damage-regulated protein 1 n=1 Tax=Hoplias malabaricus TaxID=27720 RepID=UPI003461B467
MDSSRVMEYLVEVEVAAEDVLADKQQIIDLDGRRNRNREAMNALRNSDSHNDKVRVCFGNMFIKFPKENAESMIHQDQKQLDQEINEIRKHLKAKVNHLNDLQGKPEIRGYNLSPLSNDELKAVNSILKR